MPRFGLKRMLVTFAVAAVLLGVGAEVWNRVTGHVAPPERFRRLTPGMSRAEVIAVLGPPDSVDGLSGSADGTAKDAVWMYRRFLCPEQLRLSFDESGRLEGVDDDCGLASQIWHDQHEREAAGR